MRAAENLDANFVAPDFFAFDDHIEKTPEKLHEKRDFELAPLEVFHGKAEKGQLLYSQLLAPAKQSLAILGSFRVSFERGQAARLCPAAVAVEDDGEMVHPSHKNGMSRNTI